VIRTTVDEGTCPDRRQKSIPYVDISRIAHLFQRVKSDESRKIDPLFTLSKATSAPCSCFTVLPPTNQARQIALFSAVKSSFLRVWSVAPCVSPCFAVSPIRSPSVNRSAFRTARAARPSRFVFHGDPSHKTGQIRPFLSVCTEPLFSGKAASFSASHDRLAHRLRRGFSRRWSRVVRSTVRVGDLACTCFT